MPKKLIPIKGYKELVRRIQKEFADLEFLLKRKTVETYWRVGKYISEHVLENKERAGYGEGVFEDLESDVGKDKTILRRTVQFYHTYPIGAQVRQLPWKYYQSLITVRDDTKRKELEELAIKKGWDFDELNERIKAFKQKQSQQTTPEIIPQLSVTKGRLHTYRIVEVGAYENTPFIDCGFQIRSQIPKSAEPLGLKAGDCIRQICETNLTRPRHSDDTSEWRVEFQKVSVKEEELYTYIAYVEKIIDGDTLWALIDSGFGFVIRQKLRFRGIDCPELPTPEGQRAKIFVQNHLKDLDFIIIKSYKDSTDKYDRYLVDIFYLEGEADPQKVLEQGKFLNQELLDAGLAVVMKD